MTCESKVKFVRDALRDEHRWVQQAQAGQSAGLEGLYRLYAERLYRQVLFPCLGNEAAAEDVLKETFLVVMRRIGAYKWDEEKGIFPWIAKIGKNRALDRHRKMAREGRGKGAYRQELELLAPSRSADIILEEEEERRLLQERVRTCLEGLNPRYKRVLELRMFEERPRIECAALMEIQVGTFDVLFHRALRAFQKQWEKQ